MHFARLLLISVALLGATLSQFSNKKRPRHTRVFECITCHALADEIDFGLSETSWQKKHLTGILGREQDYSKSPARAAEVLESICHRVKQYRYIRGSPEEEPRLNRSSDAKIGEFIPESKKIEGGVEAEFFWICDRIMEREAEIERLLFEDRGQGVTTRDRLCEPGGLFELCPIPPRHGVKVVKTPTVVRAGEPFEVHLQVQDHEGVPVHPRDDHPDSSKYTVVEDESTSIALKITSDLVSSSADRKDGGLAKDGVTMVVKNLVLKRAPREVTLRVQDSTRFHNHTVWNVTVALGPPSKMAFCRSPSKSGRPGAALEVQPIACVKDLGGNTVDGTGVSAKLVVTRRKVEGEVLAGLPEQQWTLDNGGVVASDASGLANFTGLVFHAPGSYELRVESAQAKGKSAVRVVDIYGEATAVRIRDEGISPYAITNEMHANFKVQAVDSVGMVMGNMDGGEATVELVRVSDGGVERTFTAVVARGEAWFSTVSCSTPGAYRIRAKVAGVPAEAVSSRVWEITGPAVNLVFETPHPAEARSEQIMSPAPVAVAKDADGNIVKSYESDCGVKKVSGPGKITQNFHLRFVAGRCVADAFRADLAGDYTFTMTSGRLVAGAEATPGHGKFKVVAGPAYKLAPLPQARAAVAGEPCELWGFVVHDTAGNPVLDGVTRYVSVTVVDKPGEVTGLPEKDPSNPHSGSISTNAEAKALFPAVVFSVPGTYSVEAWAPGLEKSTVLVKVSGPLSKVEWVNPKSNATGHANIRIKSSSVDVSVEGRDSSGRRVDAYRARSEPVELRAVWSSGGNASYTTPGDLAEGATAGLNAGRTAFHTLSFTQPGVYRVTAHLPGRPDVTPSSGRVFKILPGAASIGLTLAGGAKAGPPGSRVSLEGRLLDAFGGVLEDIGTTVTLTLTHPVVGGAPGQTTTVSGQVPSAASGWAYAFKDLLLTSESDPPGTKVTVTVMASPPLPGLFETSIEIIFPTPEPKQEL